MARSPKTPRFYAFRGVDNCFSDHQLHDNSLADYLSNYRKTVLEIGCGKASFLIKLAKKYPKTGFLGLDIKSDRMYYGATRGRKQHIANIAFVRINAKDFHCCYKELKFDQLWLTFPDPFWKRNQVKHRLTGSDFLDLYIKMLKKGGRLFLKTDNQQLFDWSVANLQENASFKLLQKKVNLHNVTDSDEDATLTTDYETKYLQEGRKIYYLESVLN